MKPRFAGLAFEGRLLAISILTGCAVATRSQEPPITIQNGGLEVKFDPASRRFSLLSKVSRQTILKDIRLSAELGTATVESVSDKVFGDGQAIRLSRLNGASDSVTIYSNLPFALFRSRLRNDGTQTTLTRKIKTFSGAVNLGRQANDLRTFGTGGLLALDKNPGSYAWLAVVEPQTRHGAVLGWLTDDRGSGVVFSGVDAGVGRLEAQIDYGRLRLKPDAKADLETLAVGYFDDARLGLEAWADAVATVHDIHLPEQPVGYCTWYSQPYGGASDETHLSEQSAFAAKHLAPFGFSVIQIDDHWQDGVSTNGPKRNFTAHNAKGPYPGGMKAAADNIKSLGLVPGLWFMPFAGTYYDPFFADHRDWFVTYADGRPYETAWGGTCLDMTQPGAREHLRHTVERIAGEWGYTYFKIDGLWTGTATKQQYVNSGYKDDAIGDAVLHDPDKTNLEAYRDGLKLVRQAAGSNVFILGCNGPQNMRSYGGAFGLVDAMRIGPDNKSDWKSLLRGPTFGSRHYFLHGRIWYNDPDPLYVRESVPLNHAQLICSWVAISGQMNLSSEWLPGLSPERLDLLKRTMPGHGLLPRPADLFERELPSLWLLTDNRREPRRDVIAVFNWESEPQRFDYALDRLGLDGGQEYAAYDFWSRAPAPAIKGRLQITVPAESCRIFAVRPKARHPQLLSTSRHITQGIVDVLEEKWDETSRTLSGRSRVVAGDPYELRIVSGAAVDLLTVSEEDASAGTKAEFVEGEGIVRATIWAGSSREVAWTVKFK